MTSDSTMTPENSNSDRGPHAVPVTVAIPAYNMERYLADAVISVQTQDYAGPLSILIWNDGSVDRTQEEAERMAREDPRIVVRHHANHGRPVTRQCLVEAAETELIAWIDPDDFASPTWIREQVDHLLAVPRRVAVGGQLYAMTPACYPIGPIDRPLTHEEIHAQHLLGGVAFNQTGVLTSKPAVQAAGGYRPEYTVGEDYDLWLRLAGVGDLSNVGELHTYYRVHEASANFTASAGEREKWFKIVNEARAARKLEPLSHDELPSPRKDDWNRRVFWINIAAREGNAWSCATLLGPALRHHPTSLVLWLFGVVAVVDTLVFAGNRTERFVPGRKAVIRPAPLWSMYQLARRLNQWRRKLVGRRS